MSGWDACRRSLFPDTAACTWCHAMTQNIFKTSFSIYSRVREKASLETVLFLDAFPSSCGAILHSAAFSHFFHARSNIKTFNVYAFRQLFYADLCKYCSFTTQILIFDVASMSFYQWNELQFIRWLLCYAFNWSLYRLAWKSSVNGTLLIALCCFPLTGKSIN